MILIFGGTTEGRASVKVAEEGGKPFYYSTLTPAQQIALHSGVRLTGAMTGEQIADFCQDKGIGLIVDAAHPFAENLHRSIADASELCGIPVIRYGRREEDIPGIVRCRDWKDAVRKLEESGCRRLLALTGVRTIPKLRDFWTVHECLFRILAREDSVREAIGYGFPEERLLFFHQGDDESKILRQVRPDAVITKDSGESGYLRQKVNAALSLGIQVFVVDRPLLPESDRTVYTESGLRRAIDELLPDFFPLKSGYTTGTCATAAVYAAASILLTGRPVRKAKVILPGGETGILKVEASGIDGGWGVASVRKHSGDDPDATDGCLISASVRIVENEDGESVRFLPGEGVGTVTLPGLGIPVGEPAVNPVPRRMIRATLDALGIRRADVSICVENGKQIALRTFNSRLGVTGGISIIGTSGIVRPFSNEAFTASIDRSVGVALALGCRTVVFNSGARSEAVLRRLYPTLPPQAFIQYGNFIGHAVSCASSRSISHTVLGMMIGKAVKLAEGHLDTHSHKVSMNRNFLRQAALEAGCTPATAETAASVNFARDIWKALPPDELERFIIQILAMCRMHCSPLMQTGRLTLHLIDEDGRVRLTDSGSYSENAEQFPD